jgi:hypothetical protein
MADRTAIMITTFAINGRWLQSNLQTTIPEHSFREFLAHMQREV